MGRARNFVEAIIIRDPHPRYALYFRHNAKATLARYTHDRNFKAVEGGVSSTELEPIFNRWSALLAKDQISSAGGVYPHRGVAEITIGMSKPEFSVLAKKRGWIIPPQLQLRFAREIDPNLAVPTDLAPLIRSFPRVSFAAGPTPVIAIYGRVVLRDGCFRVQQGSGSRDGLAIFAREAQLTRDAQGYLALRTAGYNDTPTRVGEPMIWGGNDVEREDKEYIRDLRRQCGNAPLVGVGVPVSEARFRPLGILVDSYAKARNISRRQAWDKMRACWPPSERNQLSDRPAGTECNYALV